MQITNCKRKMESEMILLNRKTLLMSYLFIHFVTSCRFITPRYDIWLDSELSPPLPYEAIISESYYGPKPEGRWNRNVTAIVLHTTKGLTAQKFLEESWKSQWNVHLIIDQDGKVYGEEYPASILYPTSPGLDEVAIHIVLEGDTKKILKNKDQIFKTKMILQSLTEKLGIVLNNFDVASREGIFTHLQVKKRFGGFIDIKDHGESELLEMFLQDLGGKYYPENEWKDRFEKEWVLRKENISAIKKSFQPDRGRSITGTPLIELKSLEQTEENLAIESRRIQYTHKGKISPSCLVLHYTAIPNYEKTISVLEARALNATFLVDKDGKAYQLLDTLYELPSTAYGTNQKCVQMEIVGKDTNDLLSNPIQIGKVVELTKELSEKFNFPISNERIESFSGVYSHTQAKKKFGGSIYLTGKDFDPGEEYMELILNKANGKYFAEKDWYDRQGNNWVILDRNFQP